MPWPFITTIRLQPKMRMGKAFRSESLVVTLIFARIPTLNKKKKMSYQAIDIANKLLTRAKREENGELMSNLKLQKMLYYEQGFHLAYFGTPLFEDEIEAWMYGPVVPSVYEHFKAFGRQGIDPGTVEVIKLEEEAEVLFEDVFQVYAVYSAIGLMERTHKEAPWKNTPTGTGSVIDQKLMKSFFKKRLRHE